MNDPDGRYASASLKHHTGADGRTIAYIGARILPDPASFTIIAEEPVLPADRVDLFAARILGNSGAWWRIADANGASDPATLEVPGERLRIPLPEPGR